jgi:2-polyprenyl-3-methyl-5-hydroxy-6-metoxy-1,4-benzoquinol methylase
MAIFEEHYENVLSDVYVWMFDGFDSGVERNIGFFQNLGIKPIRSGLAVDLGAGCGFQSIPLAQKGFSVTAIDLDTKLLDVLTSNVGELPVKIVRDDLVDFNKHIDAFEGMGG